MGRGIIVELIVKHFQELNTEELFEIYKLRISVFVVEQHCPYQEVDDADRNAYHVFFKDDSGILAYARVLPAGEIFEDVSLGRVISVKRRCGLGSEIVMRAIDVARERFSAQSIIIEAQVYARPLYEKCGFHRTSDVFLEDGIPHIQMKLELRSDFPVEKS